jgi:Clostripain family
MKSICLISALSFAITVFAIPLHSLELKNIDVQDLPAIEIPKASYSSKSVKEWTVLIYVSARNNLGLEAINDVNEMEAAGSTDKVNVVVEMGRIETDPPFNPFADPEPLPPQADWTGSRRFLMIKDSDPLRINSPVLEHYSDADMGDWKHLSEFISWGKANYPAKKYLLIVGGHGNGWYGVRPPKTKGIAYDDVSGNHISPAELAKAIKISGGVNVYASDACLMQTVEFIYAMKDSAEYIVGSQETTPGSGYNYEVFLNAMTSDPGSSLAVSQHIMAGFTGYYGSLGQSVTMSIVRPSLVGELAIKMDKFARLVLDSPADMKLYNDKRFGLRNFADEDARDLYQLMNMYYDHSQTPALKEAARDIIFFLAEQFIARNDALGYKSKNANGISIHFPFFYMNYKEKYEYLSFSRDTYWDEMIKAVVYLKK